MIPPSTPGRKCELYPGLKLQSPLPQVNILKFILNQFMKELNYNVKFVKRNSPQFNILKDIYHQCMKESNFNVKICEKNFTLIRSLKKHIIIITAHEGI